MLQRGTNQTILQKISSCIPQTYSAKPCTSLLHRQKMLVIAPEKQKVQGFHGLPVSCPDVKLLYAVN